MVKVQWSADAAPTSTATAMPSPCCSWLAWTRGWSPRAIPARRIVAGLVGVERAPVAEHVDPASVRRAGLEHGADDEGDVGVGVVRELGGHDVGAEVGGLVGDLAREAERALLVRRREPVAGLGLEGRDAAATQLAGEARESAPELVVGGGTGAVHRAADAAGRVRLARHAGRELVGAVAGEDQVGVAVDEPGQDGAARRGRRRCRSAPQSASAPTHAIRPSSTTTAASCSSPRDPSPFAGSFVTSVPMPTSPVLPGPKDSGTLALQHGYAHVALLRDVECLVVARVAVPDHAHARDRSSARARASGRRAECRRPRTPDRRGSTGRCRRRRRGGSTPTTRRTRC